jgi:hypothetical protein
VTIPADEFFFWPFNLDLGDAKLIYATAQPICRTEDGDTQTVFFAETLGVKAEFVFDPKTLASLQDVFKDVKPGYGGVSFQMKTKSGTSIQVILLNEKSSTDAFAKMQKEDSRWLMVSVRGQEVSTQLATELLQPAGLAREIPLSSDKSHVAIAPTDADFTNAAVWKINLPAKLDLSQNPILRIHYVGDVARLTLNGRLIDDNFYSGRTFDLGLKRYAPEILTGDLRLEILPLRKDAPIFFEPKDKPDFGTNETLLKLLSAEIVSESNLKSLQERFEQ